MCVCVFDCKYQIKVHSFGISLQPFFLSFVVNTAMNFCSLPISPPTQVKRQAHTHEFRYQDACQHISQIAHKCVVVHAFTHTHTHTHKLRHTHVRTHKNNSLLLSHVGKRKTSYHNNPFFSVCACFRFYFSSRISPSICWNPISMTNNKTHTHSVNASCS